MATQLHVIAYLQQNPSVMQRHMEWHRVQHSGREFLQFHRDMIRDFERWLVANHYPILTPWIPAPQEIRPASNQFRFIGAFNTLRINSRQFTDTNALGSFIQSFNPLVQFSGIHDIVHNSFASISNRQTAPNNILFWQWHKWIDNIWVSSGLQ